MNFVTRANAEAALARFSGFTEWPQGAAAAQPCQAAWSAPLQGLVENIERYRNAPVMHRSVPDDHKPALFSSSGARVSFPAPTVKVRGPRVRCRRQRGEA